MSTKTQCSSRLKVLRTTGHQCVNVEPNSTMSNRSSTRYERSPNLIVITEAERTGQIPHEGKVYETFTKCPLLTLHTDPFRKLKAYKGRQLNKAESRWKMPATMTVFPEDF